MYTSFFNLAKEAKRELQGTGLTDSQVQEVMSGGYAIMEFDTHAQVKKKADEFLSLGLDANYWSREHEFMPETIYVVKVQI